MKKRLLFCLVAAAVMIAASAICVFADDYFDTTDIGSGVIHVTYDGGGKAKVMIQKGDKKYIYNINGSGKTESYPLQLGDGTYQVSLLENTSGDNYRFVSSKDVAVKLKDANAVYLTSVQNINWNVDSKAVAKAVELTKNDKSLADKAKTLWDYVVKYDSYDYAKLATLTSGYIPIIDQTLADKKGICYDFSSLYAAMLRSEGTPAKLVTGYSPKHASGYHAWNEVYDASQSKWVVIDTTYDVQVITGNPKVAMVKDLADYSEVYEY